MSQTSSRAVRGKNPYQIALQKESDNKSKSCNPITLTLETSEIRRYLKGKKEVVEIWKNERLHSSSENNWKIND